MATEKYKKLIDEICAIAKIPHSQAFYTTADFTVDEVNFTLVDASSEPEDALALYCDFGAPPAKNRVGVLERLLQINLVLHGLNTPLFALNPETGHILLGRRIPIGQISALELMTLLTEYSAHAKEWRQTYYLEKPDVQKK
jgi:hypothetical protein